MPPRFIDTIYSNLEDVKWHKTFVLWPKQCIISDKIIWLRFGMKCTHKYGKLASLLKLPETYWADPEELLIWKLKKK